MIGPELPKQFQMTAVGFEPTQLALVELESTHSDHSGKLSWVFGSAQAGWMEVCSILSALILCAGKLFRADRCLEGAISILCARWPIWCGVKCSASTDSPRSSQAFESSQEAWRLRTRVCVSTHEAHVSGDELDPGRTRAYTLLSCEPRWLQPTPRPQDQVL